jgi:hypothetical protein
LLLQRTRPPVCPFRASTHAESRNGGDRFFPKIASQQEEDSVAETGLETLMPPNSMATGWGFRPDVTMCWVSRSKQSNPEPSPLGLEKPLFFGIKRHCAGTTNTS